MAKKSNKTSHVLSLIANKPESTEQSAQSNEDFNELIEHEEMQKELHEEQIVSPVVTTNQSKIEIKQSTDDSLSEMIRQELEKAVQEDFSELEVLEKVMSAPPEVEETKENNNTYAVHDGNSGYYNIVEELVKSKAIPTMRKLGICTCEQCINDVIALALNMLPPRYVVTNAGQLYAKLNSYEKQYAADLLSAIAKSCLQIKKNPRHPERIANA